MSGRKTQKQKKSDESQICIGRVCFEKDKYQPAPGAKYRYRGHRCDKPCEEGKNLCKNCLKHEEMFIIGDPRKWHGREGGPLPEESHIENSAWDLEWRVKEAAALQKQVAPKSERAKTAVKKAAKAVQNVQSAADEVMDAMTEVIMQTNNVTVRDSPTPFPKNAVRKAIQSRQNAGELVSEANKLVTVAERVVMAEAKRTTQRANSNRKSSSRRPSVSPIVSSMRRSPATPYTSPRRPVVSSPSIPSSDSTDLADYAENLLLA